MRLIRGVNGALERFSIWVHNWTGSTSAFVLSVFLIFVWLALGPFYHYSDTWQLVANTFTTLVNFSMAFVLQRAQNKNTDEINDKLDRLLAEMMRREVKSGKDDLITGRQNNGCKN